MNVARALVVAVLVACSGPSLPRANRWSVNEEDRSFPGVPHLVGAGERLILDDVHARLSIVTWPELDAVASEVTEDTHPLGSAFGPVLWVTPLEALEDRWYAIRWAGPLHPDTILEGAIPLADGTHVWRFHGSYVPELAELRYGEGMVNLVGLGELEGIYPVVPACDTPLPVVVLEQDGESWGVECGATELPWLAFEAPGFDPARPFRLQVRPEAAYTAEGVPYQPIDLVLESATALTVTLPPTRNPPAVPSALCAGVACE